MKTLLFFTLLICFVIFLIPLAITCKTFINDIFDKNVILINKTINFLIKIYNDEITTDNINDYINVYNKCLYNKLITIKKNRISLTKDGLNICFQYTSNKFLIINLFFTMAVLLMTIYNVLK